MDTKRRTDADQSQTARVRRRFESVSRVFTVDTSRAKSNATVVRMCLQRLGWKDVSARLLDNPSIYVPVSGRSQRTAMPRVLA
jgi:hypothetical protein